MKNYENDKILESANYLIGYYAGYNEGLKIMKKYIEADEEEKLSIAINLLNKTL